MADRSDKRDKILAASRVVFAQKGYHQTRIEDIAAQAELGKSTVYEYFPSKQVLFQEMLVQAMDGYTTFLNVPSSPNSTVRNRVERIFRMHLTFLLENKEFLALTCSDMGTMDQELVRWMHELRRQKMDRLIEILNEGVQKGEIRPMDIELAANIIHGLLHIAVVPAFIEEKDFNPGDLAKDLSQIVFEGIGLR